MGLMNLSFLLPVFRQPGPFATAYVDVSRRTEDTAHRIALEWRQRRESLISQGVTESTISAMDDAMDLRQAGRGAGESCTKVMVAADGRVLLNDECVRTWPNGRATWAALPDLLPMLSATPPQVSYLVARVDRVGADLTVYGAHDVESDEVRGGTYPIRKVAPGGWSQRRYQQRAENLWSANAHRVAEQVDRLARRHRTRVIVLSGDVRAKTALVGALSEESRAEVVEIEGGGRAAGVDDEAVYEAANKVVANRGAAEERSLREQYAAELGRGGRAVAGVPETIDALRRGQVAVLFLDEVGVEEDLWIGSEALDLGVDRSDVLTDGAQAVRGDAALIRAAAANGAALVTADRRAGELPDPAGALLRYEL